MSELLVRAAEQLVQHASPTQPVPNGVSRKAAIWVRSESPLKTGACSRMSLSPGERHDDFLRYRSASLLTQSRLPGTSQRPAFFASLPATPGSVTICELVLVELYVLLRNPAVIRNPLDPPDAVALIQTFRSHPNWRLIDHPGGASTVMEEVWRLGAQPNVGRRVIFDARLALTLRHHGVTEFATRNDTHFSGFGFSRVWNPLPT